MRTIEKITESIDKIDAEVEKLKANRKGLLNELQEQLTLITDAAQKHGL